MITQYYTSCEIRSKIASREYNAELLLRHAMFRLEESERELAEVRSLIKESVEKLDLYAKRQGHRRMRGKRFSDGTRSNPHEGQQYPAVHSYITRAKHALSAQAGSELEEARAAGKGGAS